MQATAEFVHKDELKLKITREDGFWIIEDGLTQGVNADFTKALIDYALALEDYYESICKTSPDELSSHLLGALLRLGPLFSPPTVRIELITSDSSAGGNHSPEELQVPVRPTVVCLCGSTRFWRTFQQASLQETLAGKVVLSIGAASGTDDEHFGNLPREDYDRIKAELDELHLRKIDMADEVLILNIDGYMGESTRRELAYALAQNKTVRYWETEGARP